MSDHRELKEVHLPLMKVVGMHLHRYPALKGLIHVPNEQKRTKAQGGILVAMGMRKGVHDLLLLCARRGYHGLSLELKAPGKLKQLTVGQESFAKLQHAAGWLVACSDCPAAAWQLIAWYVAGMTSMSTAPMLAPPAQQADPHLMMGPRLWGVDK